MSGSKTSGRLIKKLRLLVVDDEPSVCDCICLLLARDGHEIVAVNSGRAALAALEKENFDLIFTDYSMPGMKGDELALKIKARVPDQPVTMITGLALTMDTIDGVDQIISKPFLLDDLRQVIGRVAAKGD